MKLGWWGRGLMFGTGCTGGQLKVRLCVGGGLLVIVSCEGGVMGITFSMIMM